MSFTQLPHEWVCDGQDSSLQDAILDAIDAAKVLLASVISDGYAVPEQYLDADTQLIVALALSDEYILVATHYSVKEAAKQLGITPERVG